MDSPIRTFSLVSCGVRLGHRRCCSTFLLAVCLAGCSAKNEIPPAAAFVVTAREAIETGDKEAAMQALDASIAADPTAWAYALRARLHAEAGSDEAATADCDAGLQLDEENAEIKWILDELTRPVASRFKTEPPSSRK